MAREIPLTKGFIASVDDDDYPLLSQFSWFTVIQKCGNQYALRWAMVNGRRRQIRMHRQILGLLVSRWPLVDHRNGSGLDNQRHNLRTCEHSGNARNRRPQTATPKGVRQDSRRPGARWQARITADYKTIYLGTFSSKSEAAAAYNKAARELHGDFARPNQVVA